MESGKNLSSLFELDTSFIIEIGSILKKDAWH